MSKKIINTPTKEINFKPIKKGFRDKGSKSTALFKHLSKRGILSGTTLTKQEKFEGGKKKNNKNTIRNKTDYTYHEKNKYIVQELSKALSKKLPHQMKLKFSNIENTQKIIYSLLQFDTFQNNNFSSECQPIFDIIIPKDFINNQTLQNNLIHEYNLYAEYSNTDIFTIYELKKFASMIGHSLLYNHIENLSFTSLIGNIFSSNTNIIESENKRFQIILPSVYTDFSHGYDIMLREIKREISIPIDITSSIRKEEKKQLVLSFHDFKKEVYQYNYQYIMYLLGKQEKPDFVSLYPAQAGALKNNIIHSLQGYISSSVDGNIDNNSLNDQ